MTAENSAAYQLVGRKLLGEWLVLARVEISDDHTGSAFSVGYVARHASGRMGFVKAFDYQVALEDDDPARELERLTTLYNGERDLLDLVRRRKLRRVVLALAAGTERIPGYTPGAVSFLIFELADGDARDALDDHDPADHAPMLRLAHDAAVAMQQLHSIGVSHQDVKPSNLLVWKEESAPQRAKLGDLGCAHLPGRPSPFDDERVPGDSSYAPPEQLYRGQPLWRNRAAADLHMLGNLISFLMVGVSYNALLFRELDPSLHWLRWGGTFESVLPGLVDAHGLALRQLSAVLRADVRDEVVRLVDQLCYPDPSRRGDPVARRFGDNPYSLQRFVSRLATLHHRANLTSVR